MDKQATVEELKSLKAELAGELEEGKVEFQRLNDQLSAFKVQLEQKGLSSGQRAELEDGMATVAKKLAQVEADLAATRKSYRRCRDVLLEALDNASLSLPEHRTQSISVEAALNKLAKKAGATLRDTDRQVLTVPPFVDSLYDVDAMSADAARQMLDAARCSLRSATRSAIENNRGYRIQAQPLRGFAGKPVYLAMSARGVSICKVFSDESRCDAEWTACEDVHRSLECPFFCKPFDRFTVSGGNARKVLVMPNYGIALAGNNITLAFGSHVRIALSGGIALDAVHSAGYCYGDCKPEHFVLGPSLLDVLVDAGSMTKFTESHVVSTTEAYCLGQPRVPSARFDLSCLAATLYTLLTQKLPPQSEGELRQCVRRGLCAQGLLRLCDLALSATSAVDFCLRILDTFPEQARQCVLQQQHLRLRLKPRLLSALRRNPNFYKLGGDVADLIYSFLR